MLLALANSVTNAAYFLLVRHLNGVLPPFLLGMVFRVEFLVLMFAYMAARGNVRRLVGAEVVRNLRGLMVVAASNFLIESATIIGLRYTTALNGALFSRLDILFALVLGILFWGEKVNRRDLAAIAVLVIGCMGVLSVRLGGIQNHLVGDLLVIVAAGLVASNAFLIRFKLNGLCSEVIAFHNVLFSTVPFALASVVETRPAPIAARDGALLVALGVVEFGYYMAYYAALRAMPVWRVRALLLTVPALVLLPGALFLHDPVTPRQLGGAVLVLLGSLLLVVSGTDIARDKSACG
jgi:drug/metabolite transporter (DMT)-like permease